MVNYTHTKAEYFEENKCTEGNDVTLKLHLQCCNAGIFNIEGVV